MHRALVLVTRARNSSCWLHGPRGTRKSLVFIILGACLVALAIALNVSWIVINWRAGVLLVLGIIFFLVIIGGLVLNTIFLVREVRRNEQHDAFINAVTHELKTPIASIRLYLETLQRRELPEDKRKEFYGIMLADSDRLLDLIEQVLRAGRSRQRLLHQSRLDLRSLVRDTRGPGARCATTCPPSRSPTSSTSTPRRPPR